jgi:hypothetical protein
MNEPLDFKCPWCQLGLRLPFYYSISKSQKYRGEHRCEAGGEIALVGMMVSREML